MELFTKLYLIVLGVAATPILIGFILRKIAGKHAPAYYETDTQEEIDARRKRAREEDDYQNLRNLGIVD